MHHLALPACPIHDEDFQFLPVAERTRIRKMVTLVTLLDAAPNLTYACESLALQHPGERGMSAASLERKVRAWRKAGRDWRSLVDRAKVPALREDARLRTPEFRTYFCALCEANNRKSAGALRELVRRWKAGERIPAYGTWRELWTVENPGVALPPHCPGVPSGWSTRNLYRIKPDKAPLLLARLGLSAAVAAGPHITRHTRDLRPLELLVTDDFRLDLMCALRTTRIIDGRRFDPGVYAVGGMLLIDIATRRVTNWCLKMMARDTDGKKSVMRREDLATLVATLLAEHGLPEGYAINILTENATAAFTNEAQGALALHFGDRIRVNKTGLFNRSVALDGFKETGGKPWEKGWVESYFSRLHTELAALPGQIGSTYDLTPGDHAAKLRATEKLLAEANRYSDRAADALRLPFLDFDQVNERFALAIDTLNARTDHRIRDLDNVLEFRMHAGEPWRSESELAALERSSPGSTIGAECRSRKESPLERWKALRARTKFSPVPAQAVAPLLSAPREVKPDRGMIAFEVDRKRLCFFHEDADPRLLADRAVWTAHWSPAQPDTVFLYHRENGAFIGALPKFDAVGVLDDEAISRATARTQHAHNRMIATYRERHVDEAVELAGSREHNARILGGGLPGIRRLDAFAVPEEPEAPRLLDPVAPKAKRKAHRISELNDTVGTAPTAAPTASPRRRISDL